MPNVSPIGFCGVTVCLLLSALDLHIRSKSAEILGLIITRDLLIFAQETRRCLNGGNIEVYYVPTERRRSCHEVIIGSMLVCICICMSSMFKLSILTHMAAPDFLPPALSGKVLVCPCQNGMISAASAHPPI